LIGGGIFHASAMVLSIAHFAAMARFTLTLRRGHH
jgi:hypothetical protein